MAVSIRERKNEVLLQQRYNREGGGLQSGQLSSFKIMNGAVLVFPSFYARKLIISFPLVDLPCANVAFTGFKRDIFQTLFIRPSALQEALVNEPVMRSPEQVPPSVIDSQHNTLTL